MLNMDGLQVNIADPGCLDFQSHFLHNVDDVASWPASLSLSLYIYIYILDFAIGCINSVVVC